MGTPPRRLLLLIQYYHGYAGKTKEEPEKSADDRTYADRTAYSVIGINEAFVDRMISVY